MKKNFAVYWFILKDWFKTKMTEILYLGGLRVLLDGKSFPEDTQRPAIKEIIVYGTTWEELGEIYRAESEVI